MKIRCKRCGQELLLSSEIDISLCTLCQQVLCRPPLIETADFERTNNEPVYFTDDLYCVDDTANSDKFLGDSVDSRPHTESGGVTPVAPCNDCLDTYPVEARPSAPWRDTARLFTATIAVIAMTLLVMPSFQRLAANGLDLLAMAGFYLTVAWWWKEVKRNTY